MPVHTALQPTPPDVGPQLLGSCTAAFNLIPLYPLVSTLASVFLCRKWLSGKGVLVSVVTYAVAFIVGLH